MCDTKEELMRLAKSNVGMITTKSTSLYPSKGNPGPKLYTSGTMTQNSNGLENVGIEKRVEIIHEMLRSGIKNGRKKPIILSAVATDPREVSPLFKYIESNGSPHIASIVEGNVSCPNKGDDELIYQNPDKLEKWLDAARSEYSDFLGIKVGPVQNKKQYDQIVKLLKKYDIDFINAINSPVGFDVNLLDWKTVIHPQEGHGGIGGDDVLRIALHNVNEFYKRLKDTNIQIIGTGGIVPGNGEHGAEKHILSGANVCGVGSAYQVRGPEVFDDLCAETAEYMRAKKLTSPKQMRGKVTTLEREMD